MPDRVAEEARSLSEAVGVRVLEDRVVVHVGGDDARSWLNGQVTNDVRSTRAGDAVYALVINVKGRVLADVNVVDRGERGLAMILPRDNLDALLAHFEHYVIMEDVSLRHDGELAVVTVQGPRAEAVAAGDRDLERYPSDRLGHGGYDVLVARSELGGVFTRLVERAQAQGGGAVSEEAWIVARIRAGQPAIFADFGETTYPQEAGLEARAVSFQKGCYLGQEVVCMLENRGKLTRRLVKLEADVELSAGLALSDAAGAKIGEITSAVVDPEDGRARALGYVKRSHADAGAEVKSERGALRVVGPARV